MKSEAWYVSWVVALSNGRMCYGDGTYYFGGGLKPKYIEGLRSELAQETSRRVEEPINARQINIIGLTQLKQ